MDGCRTILLEIPLYMLKEDICDTLVDKLIVILWFQIHVDTALF